MGINNKKNQLSRISVYIIMLLFAMCIPINVLFCGNYSSYELLNKSTVNEMWTNSKRVVVD